VSSNWSLSVRSPHQNPAFISPVSHTCHMPRPSRFSEYKSLISLNVINGICPADKSSVLSVKWELRYYVMAETEILHNTEITVLRGFLYQVNCKGIRN
jgi:hypothetical protein